MKPPVLEGYVTADGVHVVIWCKYCRTLHSHGHGGRDQPVGAGNGLRAAHCHNPDSGYNHYTIKEVDQFVSEAAEKRYEQHMKRMT